MIDFRIIEELQVQITNLQQESSKSAELKSTLEKSLAELQSSLKTKESEFEVKSQTYVSLIHHNNCRHFFISDFF